MKNLILGTIGTLLLLGLSVPARADDGSCTIDFAAIYAASNQQIVDPFSGDFLPWMQDFLGSPVDPNDELAWQIYVQLVAMWQTIDN